MPRVFVTRSLPESVLQPLADFDVTINSAEGPVPRSRLEAEVQAADGLLTMLTDRIDGPLLDLAANLKVVSQMAVGFDNIDVEECRKRGIAVGYTPGVLTETVADHAFALLGAIVRRLPEGMSEVRSGEWGPWEPFHLAGGDLHGSVLGIVGMGRIGAAIAKRAGGFDMDVLFTSRSSGSDLGRRVELDELVRASDHVIVAAALTEETLGLIGATQFEAMKPTAYLVNIARGPLIDTEALVRALDDGLIAGAALDVTDPEPLPANHALTNHPRCLIVPHLGSASVATHTRMAELAVQNLIAGVRGSALPYPVPDR